MTGKTRKKKRKRYIQRDYRHLVSAPQLHAFNVTVKETDLWVQTSNPGLEAVTRESMLKHRRYLETYIESHPYFATALEPIRLHSPAPPLVMEMTEAGREAGVGPMAAVAGAIAQNVGRDLLAYADTVIIENGGDVFFKAADRMTVAIFAGSSPLSLQVGLQIDPDDAPFAVCTSSGTVGESLSRGKADAVCVLSGSCALADAAATAICNRIRTGSDIDGGIDFGKKIKGVEGIVVIVAGTIGAWGDVILVPIPGKNG